MDVHVKTRWNNLHWIFPILAYREEVLEHKIRGSQNSQRATELEGLLATVKTRVQDLEDRYLGKAAQQLSHTQQLQQEKQDAQVGNRYPQWASAAQS